MLKLAGFNSTIYSFNNKTWVSLTPMFYRIKLSHNLNLKPSEKATIVNVDACVHCFTFEIHSEWPCILWWHPLRRILAPKDIASYSPFALNLRDFDSFEKSVWKVLLRLPHFPSIWSIWPSDRCEETLSTKFAKFWHFRRQHLRSHFRFQWKTNSCHGKFHSLELALLILLQYLPKIKEYI